MEMLVIAVIAVVAFAAVLVPLFRRRPGYGDEREFENIPSALPATQKSEPTSPAAEPTTPADVDAAATDDDELELEVKRYRAAVRAHTVCSKCGQANPADSSFCFECGAALPRADAREFE